jgi:hypothetical protein
VQTRATLLSYPVKGKKRGTLPGYDVTTSLALQTRAATFPISIQSIHINLPRSVDKGYILFPFIHSRAEKGDFL